MSEQGFIWLQKLLPKRAISLTVGWLCRIRGGRLSHAAIRWFVKAYGVDLSEAAKTQAEDYASFNAFFTRELAPGKRPQPPAPDTVSAAADGCISEMGDIEDSRLLQAKGILYTLDALFDGDQQMAEPFRNGQFMTTYLAPYNYHRVHMPLSGNARQLRYVPGALFSVNGVTARNLKGLFCRNERVCVSFDADGGSFALIMVGALNVGSIDLTLPSRNQFSNRPQSAFEASRTYDLDQQLFQRGDEFGRFNMGSTVILVASDGLLQWDSNLSTGTTLIVGQAVGQRVS